MRIISQNKQYDIPHENFSFVLNKKCCEIEARSIGGEFEPVMATYSTEEKAIKAMEMLHEEYLYLKQCEIVGNYVQMPPVYFQFPQDSEV